MLISPFSLQAWRDIRLKWDPARYDGVDHTRIRWDKIWRPDITLYNRQVCGKGHSVGMDHVHYVGGGFVTKIQKMRYFPLKMVSEWYTILKSFQ
jgi:hypothetical protein